MLALASFALLLAAASACNNICLRNWEPLCGSNGRTYANRCELDSLNCRAKSAISVAYAGECRSAPVCNSICQFNWAPVCGTDGKTYGNRCELESLACRARNAVSVAFNGECIKKAAAPVCNSICQFNWSPVCGTDGKTYGNRCELESLACRARNAVSVAFNGECIKQAVKTASCKKMCTREWRPVCGTDGVTYANRCALESLSCAQRKSVAISFEGECSKAVKTPTCNNICTFDYTPVCGTDGKTYGNRCELESLACLRKTGVTLARAGIC